MSYAIGSPRLPSGSVTVARCAPPCVTGSNTTTVTLPCGPALLVWTATDRSFPIAIVPVVAGPLGIVMVAKGCVTRRGVECEDGVSDGGVNVEPIIAGQAGDGSGARTAERNRHAVDGAAAVERLRVDHVDAVLTECDEVVGATVHLHVRYRKTRGRAGGLGV
jgi:hypothetical protein